METIKTIEHDGKKLVIFAPDQASAGTRPMGEAPGAGKVEFLKMEISSAQPAPGTALTISASLDTENVAWIFTELLLHDAELGQYYGPILQEHVPAPSNHEVAGVIHPLWQNHLELSVSVTPGLRLLTNGADSALAFASAGEYGKNTLLLNGIYTPASTGKSRRAGLVFDAAGNLLRALSYKQNTISAAPRALKFKPGDQFQPYIQIFQPSGQSQQGLTNALTHRGEPFRLQSGAPIPGEYLLGLAIRDVAGAWFRQYKSITISA